MIAITRQAADASTTAPTSGAVSSTARRHAQNKSIGRGVSWTAFGTIASKGISLLGKLVCAGLLLPEHFGMVSMILVFTQVVKGVSDLGLRQALIQRKRDGRTRELYDSAFWFLLAVGSGLVMFMWLIGVPSLVWFYDAPQLSSLALAISVGILFHNIQVVPEAILIRIGRFKAITLSETAGALIGSVAAVLLAYHGAGAWSLVAHVLIAYACTIAGLLIAARWLPRLRFGSALLKSLRVYSAYVLGSRAMVHLQQNLDYLLLGKLMGAYALGVYTIAFLLTETLRTHIYWIVSRVVFPVYSRVATTREDVRRIYCGTVRYMTLAMFPISMLFILYAGSAVDLFLDDRWAEAVEPIRVLAIASMIVASAGTASDVLKAIGKPHVDFSVNLRTTVLVAFPALLIGIHLWGAAGAAMAVAFYYAASRVMFHLALRREIGVRVVDVMRAAAPAIAGSLLMLLCALAFGRAHWILAAAASAAIYLIAVTPVLYAFWWERAASGRVPEIAAARTVVILGPDGAGKSSLACELENCLGVKSARLYLGMGMDEAWRLRSARTCYEHHLTQRRGWARALSGVTFWYVLFPLEILARRICALRFGRSLLVIDRLPGRPYLRAGPLSLLYRLLLPKPDLVVLLSGDPEVIALRKPEETNADRTRIEMCKWETVASRTGAKRIVRLDTTCADLRTCCSMLLEACKGAPGTAAAPLMRKPINAC